MSYEEHYFENLLLHGKDVNGDSNKKMLSENDQELIELCANYVIYSLFHGREDIDDYINKYKHWMDKYNEDTILEPH